MRVKKGRKDTVVKRCLDAAFHRRRHSKWKMTSQQILTDVRAGALFGMIRCDVGVPEELRAHFAEMQPIFKNIDLTRDDLGPFMLRYAAPEMVPGTRTRGDAVETAHEHAPRSRHDVVFFGVSTHERSEFVAGQTDVFKHRLHFGKMRV